RREACLGCRSFSCGRHEIFIVRTSLLFSSLHCKHRAPTERSDIFDKPEAINISPLCGSGQSLDQFTEMDRQLMARALELAARGIGQVSPGPLVGTVIVGESGEVVGEGFYLYDQVMHAETVALEQAGSRAP